MAGVVSLVRAVIAVIWVAGCGRRRCVVYAVAVAVVSASLGMMFTPVLGVFRRPVIVFHVVSLRNVCILGYRRWHRANPMMRLQSIGARIPMAQTP